MSISGTRRFSTTGSEVKTKAETTQMEGKNNVQIRLLYDGDCPLCEREVDMLRRRSDERGGTIDFVDIASKTYSPAENKDIDFETAMTKIHGILPNGSVVTDIEAFKKAYEAVGLGWVYAFTQVPPLRVVAEVLYNIWARNRLRVTGRSDLDTILSEKKVCSTKRT
eukprot:CAMPEP_0114513006 /NCGR_PEP_ID=MMETSP0109-20121206/15307_1 /TAXON_ID=29199 /ORGANISM="Chlorarachnion reptans, Strain CCCM449" /LENGTH=165 /DNA_ID=CAMNT_0001692785 /DNA_START=318 /DNA_END=815 /DNA_ORIENTATION=+